MSIPSMGNVTEDPTIQGSCLKGGDWHFCSAQSPKFFGCCTSDPCNPRGCPKSNLRPASLGSGPGPNACENDSSFFPDTDCPVGSLWYTCLSNTPSFQGCCSVNPCIVGSCPPVNLFPASYVKKNLPTSILESCITATNPATTDPTPPIPTPSPNLNGLPASTHNLGIIIGSTIGVLVAVALLGLGTFCWYRTKKSRLWHMKSRAGLEREDVDPDIYSRQLYTSTKPVNVPQNPYQPSFIVPQTHPGGVPIHEIGSSHSLHHAKHDMGSYTGIAAVDTSPIPERNPYRCSNFSDSTACSNPNRYSQDLFHP